MAILEMSNIFVCGINSDRKAVLEALHQKEIVEICEPDSEEVSFKETAKNIAQFEKYMQSAESSLVVLNEYAPKKSGFFQARRILPIPKYHMSSAHSDETLHSIYHIIGLSEKIQDHTESIRRITAKQTALEPYLALDIPMNMQETEYTCVKTGRFNDLWTAERLRKELEDSELASVYFEILNASKEYTTVWFSFLKKQEQKVLELLRQIGFTEPPLSLSHHTPAQKAEVLEESKRKLSEEIEGFISEIEEQSSSRHDIELFYDHLSLRKDKYQVLSKTGMTEHTFMLEGYIPKKYGEGIKQLIESKWTAYVELTEPESPDNAPVMFQNGVFAAPVEEITETYSMPSPTDVDPNPIMAFFYYLFFGMMFSDAGYGLLLALVCGYLGFSKRLEKPKRKNYQMFFFCGVSTTIWGLLYGGFFGNIVYTISTTFAGKEISLAPIWLDPISGAMNLLIFSVALGLVQILVGMGIRFYIMCRQKKVFDAVCDIGFWMIVLLGICSLAAGMGLQIPLLTNIGMWVAILGGAGLLLTGGRKNKNIVGKVFGGILGLYDITGYVSDALSYCRLMALGLATGAIANVVNMLASMFGNSVSGIIMFVVIAIFGHCLNFAMNILGAYVHTNRLQYVEFFSKFYDGGGRKFTPFQMNTKYCQFSEE